MKRSSSIHHIPSRSSDSDHHRISTFTPPRSMTSLLVLPDDILLRIFHFFLDTNVLALPTFSRLPGALPLASTCQRLRHIFFSSVSAVDCTVHHSSNDLPPQYRTKFCTTCPLIVPFPAIMVLVQRSCATLQTIRLPKLDTGCTILIISTVAESCFRLRVLSFTDSGAISVPLAQALLSNKNLTSLTVYEPSGSLLQALSTSLASPQKLSLVSVFTSHGTLITRILDQNASNLRSLSISFFNEKRLFSEPFAFQRNDLHRIYPDMSLELPSPVAGVFTFIASGHLTKLPFLSELNIATLGADRNEEGCDLINCRSPFSGLDALCGIVFLIRRYLKDRCHTHCLKHITLRTDHLVLHAGIRALSNLLSSRVKLTIQVNHLTLDILPISLDALTISNINSSNLSNAVSYAWKKDGLLNHFVRSVCLESLLINTGLEISDRSDFSKLCTADAGSGAFFVEYGRNPEVFRPKLIAFLQSAESSLHTIRFSGSIHNYDEHRSASLVYDILSHVPNVKTLELSDAFLVMARHHGFLTEMFIHLGTVEIIRFGCLSWVSYPSTSIFTAQVAEFPSILVDFFTAIGRSCPFLTQLVRLSTYNSCWAAKGHERLGLVRALQALDDLEENIPSADTCSVRAQIRFWTKTENLL